MYYSGLFILFLLSLSAFDSVVALLYTLNSPCGSTVEALEILQTSIWVLCHLGIDLLAISTPDIIIDVKFVDSCYMLVLELSLENQISLATKVTLSVELRLEEVEHMLLLTRNLSANWLKVLPRGLGGREEFSHGCLALDVDRVFRLLCFSLHCLLNAVQHVVIVVILMAIHLVQVKLL